MISGEFWAYLDQLAAACPVVVDRPAGSRHPTYPTLVYPLDYGYLEGSTTVDGGGVDVWLGADQRQLVGLALTVDLKKKDTEIKLLIGCTPDDIDQILDFLNGESMRAIYIERPKR